MAVVALVLVTTAVPVQAQVDEDYSPPSELGVSISIPRPNEGDVDNSRYTSPELPDTTPAVGSQLVDGRLPRPRLDYAIVTPKALQRVSIFEKGLVVLHFRAGNATLRKRMILPQGALDEYLQMITPDEAARIARNEILINGLSADRGIIRLYRDDGSHEMIEFSNSRILPSTVQQLRSSLDDLIRVLAEDRGATNPMSGYTPRLGDKLISEDMKLFEITHIAQQDEIVEFTGLQEPVRLYVPMDDIPSYFNAVLGRNPN
jgi:hypothetical protein